MRKDFYKYAKEHHFPQIELPCEDLTQDPLIDLIYSPDPVTGLPRNDISVIMSKDSSPEVAQYVRDNLMRPRQSNSVDDPDFAIESMRNDGESIEEYGERLKSLVNPKQE